ncbi:hypothetical protein ACA910_022438 [Epithemia clementina (nom. ined.)]
MAPPLLDNNNRNITCNQKESNGHRHEKEEEETRHELPESQQQQQLQPLDTTNTATKSSSKCDSLPPYPSPSNPPVLAATLAHYRSPTTLIPAKSSRFPTPLPTHWWFMAWCLAIASPSLFYLGPLLLVLPPFLYLLSPRSALALLLFDGILLLFPHRPWPSFRSVYQLWYELFDFHHNLLLLDDKNKNVNQSDKKNNNGITNPPPGIARISETEADFLTIHAMHPHGVIPIQTFLWMTFCDQYMPNLYGFGATTDIAMRLPLLRQIMLWGTSGSASRRILKAGLEQGQNLYLLPGGVAEIFLSQPGTHRIKAQRRGLMKLALQTGAALVPIYVFGGNDFFCQLSATTTEWLSRNVRAGITLFWGQYGLPMPHRIRCSMVLGDPIFPSPQTIGQGKSGNRTTCRKIPNPSDDEIEELLQRYTNALQRLFDQYKTQAGCPEDAKLEIQ